MRCSGLACLLLLSVAGAAQPAAALADDTKLGVLDVTGVNGAPLPVPVAPLVATHVMMDIIDSKGMRVVVLMGTRRPGTRAPIHVHDFGGHTCVFSGEITIFMEGHAPLRQVAGTCYDMPPAMLMSAANLGTEDAVLTDTFSLPPGQPLMTVREKGYTPP